VIQTVLFDLDGTLLDTAPDLAAALNTVLIEQQRPPLPLEQIRPWISLGGKAMIKNGLNIQEHDVLFAECYPRFLAYYTAHLAEHTRLFPGMTEVLATLERWCLNWGIVTNKISGLTEPLLQQLGLSQRSVCTVSGDTLAQKKPHPAPLLHACQCAGCLPHQCVYIGDAERDIEAGRRAGMPTLVALYGYIGADEQPSTWGAQAMLQQPEDLLTWLEAINTV